MELVAHFNDPADAADYADDIARIYDAPTLTLNEAKSVGFEVPDDIARIIIRDMEERAEMHNVRKLERLEGGRIDLDELPEADLPAVNGAAAVAVCACGWTTTIEDLKARAARKEFCPNCGGSDFRKLPTDVVREAANDFARTLAAYIGADRMKALKAGETALEDLTDHANGIREAARRAAEWAGGVSAETGEPDPGLIRAAVAVAEAEGFTGWMPEDGTDTVAPEDPAGGDQWARARGLSD